jgi:ubiquinone/menaquinone biosynthesis C-methylase UbiE
MDADMNRSFNQLSVVVISAFFSFSIAYSAGLQVVQDPPAKAKKRSPSKKQKENAKSDEAKDDQKRDASNPAAPKRLTTRVYKGRQIAEVMSYEGGAEWLVRPEREQEEHPEEMLDAMDIRQGDVVADVGAGVGYLSLRIARRVGPKGKVLASDIQAPMLEALQVNSKNFGITNIKTIRATPTDSKLPEAQVDLALMTDVYHELSQPELTISSIRRALKPRGRLVLVEFRGEDPEVPIREEHKMTLAQVRREIEPMGFEFVESNEELPWQHVIIFEKPAAKSKARSDREKKSEKESEKGAKQADDE